MEPSKYVVFFLVIGKFSDVMTSKLLETLDIRGAFIKKHRHQTILPPTGTSAETGIPPPFRNNFVCQKARFISDV